MLLLLLGILLSLPFVQTALGKYATDSLNKSFGTNIAIGKVAITPFLSVKLGDVLVLDHHKDTLFCIKKLNTSILSLKKIYDPGHPYLKDVVLHGMDVRIINYKNEDYTNLDKFIEAFDDGSPSSGRFRMKANKMTVFNSRFRYIDENRLGLNYAIENHPEEWNLKRIIFYNNTFSWFINIWCCIVT